MNADHDPLLEALKALPPRDADPWLAERVQRQAHAALAAPAPGALAWSRFVLPLVLACVVGGYLTWAVNFTAALYR